MARLNTSSRNRLLQYRRPQVDSFESTQTGVERTDYASKGSFLKKSLETNSSKIIGEAVQNSRILKIATIKCAVLDIVLGTKFEEDGLRFDQLNCKQAYLPVVRRGRLAA